MANLPTEKKVVPIDSIIANFWNPNHMGKFVYEQMKKTIAEKGLFGAIIVRRFGEKYQILDGQHRWQACKELGWTEIPVECAIKDVSDGETQFWTIYFNNTRGKDEIEKRAEILKNLELGQAQLLPFTEDEIKNEKDLIEFDFSIYETEDPGIPSDTLAKILSIKFTKEEWEQVEIGLGFAKEDKLNQKQWFMGLLKSYVDHKQFNLTKHNTHD